MSYSFVFLNGEDPVVEECLNAIKDLDLKLIDLRIMSNNSKYISKTAFFDKKPIIIEKFNKDNFNANEFDIIFIKESPENIQNEQIDIDDVIDKVNNKTFHGKVIYCGYKTDIESKSQKIHKLQNPISLCTQEVFKAIGDKSEIEKINIFSTISLAYLDKIGMDLLFKDTRKFFESAILDNLNDKKIVQERKLFIHDTAFTTINKITLKDSETDIESGLRNEITKSLSKYTKNINFDMIQIPVFRVDGVYITIFTKDKINTQQLLNSMKNNDLFTIAIDNQEKASSRESVEKGQIYVYKISEIENMINIYINFDHIGILSRFIINEIESIINE